MILSVRNFYYTLSYSRICLSVRQYGNVLKCPENNNKNKIKSLANGKALKGVCGLSPVLGRVSGLHQRAHRVEELGEQARMLMLLLSQQRLDVVPAWKSRACIDHVQLSCM